MRRTRVVAVVALLAALLALLVGWPPVEAAQLAAPPSGAARGAGLSSRPQAAELMPLHAVEKGMRGELRTVVEGTEVESFDVEILGVLPNASSVGDLIIIQASEPMMERTGGIAAGMSGSPVYVDGKLVGAVGYGFDMSDHRIGLVTPIHKMAELLERVKPGGGAGEWAMELPEGDDLRQRVAQLPRIQTPLEVVPLRTPVLVGGFSDRAFERLSRELEKFSLVPVQAGAGSPAGVQGRGVLEPGAAFGVQLVRGDFTLTSIGTVTHVDGEYFVGFGHPFMNRGDVALGATEAYVHRVVHGVRVPFKLSSPLGEVGAILQDRGAGVAGRLGQSVPMLRFRMRVWDEDQGREQVFTGEIVRDEDLLVTLAGTTALAAIDRALDRIGPGTARLQFRVDGAGMPKPLVRSNMFYSDQDVAAVSLIEFVESLRLLVANPFEDPGLSELEISAEIGRARQTARIEAARPAVKEVKPGDTVEVEVTLRPYRQETVTERLSLTIPADASEGQVNVVVRAGGWGGPQPPDPEKEPLQTEEGVTNLALLVDDLAGREKNNDLVAELYPRRERSRDDHNGVAAPGEGGGEDEPQADPGPEEHVDSEPEDDSEGSVFGPEEPADSSGEGAGPGEWGWGDFGSDRVYVTVPTPYVLTGSTSFELTIVAADEGGTENKGAEEEGEGAGENEGTPGEGAGAPGEDEEGADPAGSSLVPGDADEASADGEPGKGAEGDGSAADEEGETE